jgi:hypothetical protein
VREVVGLHKERYVFPISIAVTKVSGTGQDSVFMGVAKPAPDDPSCVKVRAHQAAGPARLGGLAPGAQASSRRLGRVARCMDED